MKPTKKREEGLQAKVTFLIQGKMAGPGAPLAICLCTCLGDCLGWWCQLFYFIFFLNRNVGSEELVNQLVNELVRVSVEPQLRGHGRLVEMVTLVAALARLDEHDRSGEAFAVGAGEGDGGGARATRPAAAAVSAHSAVVGPVQASAPAAGVGQTVRLGGLVGSGALPSFLWRHGVKGRKGGVSK